jgi:hypothetical protein
MVSSSKILTVSYGTFSCTAEGFDDPLAVVKEATQFFRGVVGEDRFFGAEPPQFDPELAGDIMRAQLGGRHGAGTVSLGRPGSGALTAAPARGAEVDRGLPDDDTIEATAVLTERPLRESAEAGPDDGLTAPVSAQGSAKTSQPPAGDADGIAASAAMEDTAATPVAAATETRATEAKALAGDAPAPRPSEPVGSVGAMGTAAKLDRIRAVVAGHGAPVAAVAAAAGPLVADPAPQESPAPGQTAEAPEPAPSLLVDDGFIEPEHTLAAPQTPAPEATEQEDEDQTLTALLGALQEDPQAQADAPSGDAGLTALATPDLDAAALDADEDRAFADTIAGLMAGAEDTAPAPLADQAPAEVQAEAEDAPQAEAEPAETAPAAAEPVEAAEAEAAGHDSQSDADTAEPQAEAPAVTTEAEAPRTEAEEPAPMAEADALVAEAEAPVAEAEREQDEAADLRAASDAPEQDEAAEARAAEVDEAEAVFEPSAEEAEVPQPDAEPLAAEAEAPQPADEPAAAEAAPQPRAEAGAAPVRARVVKVKRADFEKAVASGTLEEVQDEAEGSATGSLSAEEEEELARELAAVKAELSAGFDGWDDEDDDADEAPQAARQQDRRQDHGFAEDDLDDEDEDEEAAFDARLAAAAPLRLDNPISRPDRNWSTDIDALDARASAALDRAGEDSDPAIDEAVRDSARKAVKMASPARALLTEGPVADQDTSRLIDQTNSEMDEPEGNRRRSAIAHLRAAVAATKADRLMGSRKPEVSDAAEAYREDLASVVRPRRPQAPTEAGARTERPAAPLKLVAEQRVTAPAGSDTPNTVPIRPRRVRRLSESRSPRDSAPAVESDGSGFAAYAESVGAADLPELLEAAAAYMSYVEGRDQFSRPQLMTTVRQAEATESSREDRLRSFGQLLREGKIRKTTGGRFTASERISFRPDRAVS